MKPLLILLAIILFLMLSVNLSPQGQAAQIKKMNGENDAVIITARKDLEYFYKTRDQIPVLFNQCMDKAQLINTDKKVEKVVERCEDYAYNALGLNNSIGYSYAYTKQTADRKLSTEK